MMWWGVIGHLTDPTEPAGGSGTGHRSSATEGNRAQGRRQRSRMKFENGISRKTCNTCHNLPQLPRLAGLGQRGGLRAGDVV
jgi:hypothetical protein